MIRVRIVGEDKRIYRLGRWDDPVAVARAQAIAAEIWSDIQRGELDTSLSRYRPQVEEEKFDLLQTLKRLTQGRSQRPPGRLNKPQNPCNITSPFPHEIRIQTHPANDPAQGHHPDHG